MPDGVDSLIVLKWLQNRKSILLNRKIREWTDACLQIDSDPSVVMWQHFEIREKYASEFDEFLYSFTTNHFDTYSIASLVAGIVAFAKQKGITGKLKMGTNTGQAEP